MKALVGLLLSALAVSGLSATTEKSKTVYVQFIIGTDQSCSEPSCHEIGPKLSQRLSPVFRWKHFWETERKKLALHATQLNRVELPRERKLELKFTNANELELRLTRRSGLVTKTHYKLDSPMAVLGGEDESKQSFFVIVRSDTPVNE